MSRVLSILCCVLGFAIFGSIASAEVVDRGPPYTNDDFLALSKSRMPRASFGKDSLENWWARAPEYLRKRVLNSPSHMWWPIILCNFMGFQPDAPGDQSAEKCEQDWYKNSQRGKSSWSPDGEWVGPSDACVKRDKRSKWGELICD